MFNLKSSFVPTGDQPQAIEKLIAGINYGLKNQVLLGVTGSGKTFTMANIIRDLKMPALIISHNKTLAGQLYQEMRDFFPENGVSYFVSYYDYYQPEAYVPQTDTYIEKEAEINELIDKLRLQSTTNIMTRKDVIVVASVSCIYNIGSPVEYGKFILEINLGQPADWNGIAKRMVELQYERSEFDFKRGSFRIRGKSLDIYPAYEDFGYRITEDNGKISGIVKFEPLSGVQIQNSEFKIHNEKSKVKKYENNFSNTKLNSLIIYPAKHYLMDPAVFLPAEKQIRADLAKEHAELKAQGKLIEAERLLKRVNYDLELIREVGYVNGIENYSRYFDGRRPGDPPFTLLDFFRSAYGNNFLVFIDESHMTVPQLRGMYNGDYSRKNTLIDFGFRLKAAHDNRPYKFDEFYKNVPHLIYVSATPDEWEIDQAIQELKIKNQKSKIKMTSQKSKLLVNHNGIVEQLIRPTGIVDPEIVIKPAEGEVLDLLEEIKTRVVKSEKVLVTTLTKKMAEDLTEFLKDKNIRASYLHSDIQTLERSDVLDNLRKNEFDVLIGVNLLREGLDLPEVTLVAILDADKEGFLRSKTSLIQTMGRAARNIGGKVIIYADTITGSIKGAIEEIERRRNLQLEYNRKHGIVPKTIHKPIRQKIVEAEESADILNKQKNIIGEQFVTDIKPESLTPFDKKRLVKRLEREMKRQAEDLNFELAIKIRDKVREIKQ